MRVDVFTIFPEYVDGPLGVSLVGKAGADGLPTCACQTRRNVTTDKHRSVDDEPFGGGAGMVMTPGPLFDAVDGGATRASVAAALGERRSLHAIRGTPSSRRGRVSR